MHLERQSQISKFAKSLEPPTSAGSNAIHQLSLFPGEHIAAVGLSGGVDSSLSAALLVEAGWEIAGVTLWLMSGKGSCCSDGLVDAAGICDQLGIQHHIIDSREIFKEEIINNVVQSYQEGITPLPCSRCNKSVKFKEMVDWAKANLNNQRIATGHYARIKYLNENDNSPANKSKQHRHLLLRGLDKNKDQSYFLYDLSQEILGQIIFPLGELTKSDTRKEAERFGLRTAEKPESQDLCLAEHHGSMNAFLKSYLPPREGEIVLSDGTSIGQHNGIEHYTIGQRKGIGVSWHEPLYVIKLEKTNNQVVVGNRQQAGKSNCTVGEVNWVSISPPKEPTKVEVQIRYKSEPVLAEIIPIEPSSLDIQRNRPYRCELKFFEDQFSITPGQAAVFYQGDILLGGGLIQT